MKRLQHIKIKTLGRIFIIGLLLLGTLVTFIAVFVNHNTTIVQAAWNRFEEDRSEKSRVLNTLYTEIGYGGMIYYFKNFILRGGKERFHAAFSRIDGARSVIARYKVLATTPKEQQALSNILQVLEQYDRSLTLAEELNSQGLTPNEIDEAIKIDDALALAGLNTLEKEIADTRATRTNEISKPRLIFFLRKAIGYGGVTHYFKNFILQGDQSDMEAAVAAFTLAKDILRQYNNLEQTAAERQALATIAQTLADYENAFLKVKQLITEGKTPTEIDRAVIIDDGPALLALNTITRELVTQSEAEELVVDNILHTMSTSMAFTISMALVLIISLIFIAVWLIRSQIVGPIMHMTNTMSRLARNELDVDIQVKDQHNEVGEMARAVQVFKDNAVERIKAEQNLRAILDTVIDGIISANANGIIQTCNPGAGKIFNYLPEELIGKNLKILMPEPYHSEHDGYLENYHATRKPKIIGIGREVEGKRSDGSIFPMDLAVNEMEVGGQRYYVGIIRDITERKRVDKLKNEFISTVSHELRTPLTSIRGSLGLISGDKMGELPEQVKDLLRIASNNTERLLLLINDILDMQKIESGMMPFRFHNLELMPFLKEVIENLTAYANQYNVRYVITQEIKGVSIFADRERLTQVIYNVLSNAAKFSPPGAEVEISVVRHHDNRLRISVTDYGPGIPEEFKPKIFERFTQYDASDSRKKSGTGLGLAISKAIMQKHGGQIGFVSREGIGSTFYIEFPEMRENNLKEDPSQPKPLPEKHLPCVLIVEDDPDVAALLQRMLTEAGFNSDIAYTAAQARHLLASGEHEYKLVTLDILLPGEDGISLLTSMRNNPATFDLPVVIVSVKADETKKELNGGAANVLDWMPKPIDQDRLTSIVNTIKNNDVMPKVLHVEDEPDVHDVVKSMLTGKCELTWTSTLSASREILENEDFDLVLLDILLPDGSGLDLLETIEQRQDPAKVVIFSAQDVSDEYADKVSSILVKAKTSNKQLLDTLLKHMKCWKN